MPVVTHIHTAPASGMAMIPTDSVIAEEGRGLVGDRYHGTRHRHVTVQSQTSIDAAADVYGDPIGVGSTRRNVTISHGEVPAAPGARITIGDVQLEVVRVAAPCKLLDEVIGDGARRALSRRAGSVCRLVSSGTIRIGDAVVLLDPPTNP